MYRLRIGKAVKHNADHLPGRSRQRVRRPITALADDPHPSEAKQLQGLANRYRIAVDGWRVIYRLDEERQAVVILAIRRKSGPETDV